MQTVYCKPRAAVEPGAAGSRIYRVNRVKDASHVVVACPARDERVLPATFLDYVESPQEYQLSAVATVVEVHTRNLSGGKTSSGLAVRFVCINKKAIALYLVSLYCSLAVLMDDAIVMQEGVKVGKYHEYK